MVFRKGYDHSMSTTEPKRPEEAKIDVDEETLAILVERDARFSQDLKTVVDGKKSIANIRRNLKRPEPSCT